MKKKRIICGVIASSLVLASTFGGCRLISRNTAADMNQIITEVDISKAAAIENEFGDIKNAVGTTSIIKRELIAYYINYGYTYTQNYGYTAEQTFNLLLDALVDNAVLVQYATMYLLKDMSATNANALNEYIEKSKISDKEKYEYLLGGADSKDVTIAKYNLYSSINNAIDSREREVLKEETSEAGEDTRTTPDGVDTPIEDYYPADADGNLDYRIYTGYEKNTLEASGAYKRDKIEGTSRATRIEAYGRFISSLSSDEYNLVDMKNEDLRDVESLKYLEDEYVNQLEQRVVERYYDVYEANLITRLNIATDEAYGLVQATYNSLLASQTANYDKESNFTSAMDEMSDTSFILYSPASDYKAQSNDSEKYTYGFVYNILLPFDDRQSDALKALQSIYADEDLDGGYKPAYYVARNALLKDIKTTDQRAAWFNGETEYAFNAKDANINYYKNGVGSDYLFFENNISNADKYEPLKKYAGLYPYNGTVVEKDNDYLLIPNKLDIDGMLEECANYINFVLGGDQSNKITLTKNPVNYDYNISNIYKVDDSQQPVTVNGKKQIDYENFVYAKGKVDLDLGTDAAKKEQNNRTNLLDKTSTAYKVLSAVNELQYAYTTDTGVLSQYLGYSVSAGDTSYIKEFEYAAHEAIKDGAGSFAVCAGDYGWHLIYVTYTFDAVGGAQYTPDWENNIPIEGTFENLFYEWYKSNTLTDVSTKKRSQIITDYKVTATVTKYQSRYQNLLDLQVQS